MIVGAGVDVVPIARVARLVGDHRGDLRRIFTTGEQAWCKAARAPQRDGRYAAAFAAKEAVLKALGSGWRSDLEWSDIDTRARTDDGTVVLSGGTRREADRQAIVRVFVSVAITADAGIAAAVAEAAGGDAGGGNDARG